MPVSRECERTDREKDEKRKKKISDDTANHVSMVPLQPRWFLLENERPGPEDGGAWKVHIHK